MLFNFQSSIYYFISLLGVYTKIIFAATDFTPCSDPCNGGDVNYHLVATVETMKLLNYTYRGRVYTSGDGLKDGLNEASSFMGPTMRVRPGQSFWVKFTNNLTSTSDIGPDMVTPENYWKMLEKQNDFETIKYDFYKEAVADPSLMEVDNFNIPGNFDSTNLHLHGLDVEVHMFDPVGTQDPDAPHVKVNPGECYCYKFNIPEHHPSGMYWYHPHLHGSTAVQMWGGMIGLLFVDGPLESELADYGVKNMKEFVIWDPALKAVTKPSHNLEVDEFLMGQTTLSKIHPFTVNGEINPSFETSTGEVLHLRVLCATVENENTFIVYPEGEDHKHWDEAAIDFWVIGADGVTYPKPKRKRIVVMAGGQRNEILLKFDKPGTYVISQQGIQGMQFFDMYGHPHDQILATIHVRDSSDPRLPTLDIEDMRFTPGYEEEESIQGHDIVNSETIVFSMGADRDTAPFPQYYVNGQPFEPGRLDFFAEPGEAREYVLVNANHNVHPFHIHVNRFQIKEMGSELSTEKYPVLEFVLDYDKDMWRDTVVVPPNGRAKIWVQYKNYTGKTVFHCHFLAHEDTGMMSTLFIGPKDFSIWRWKDENIHLLFVLSFGVSVSLLALLLYCVCRKETSYEYSTVITMNGLKSKVLD